MSSPPSDRAILEQLVFTQQVISDKLSEHDSRFDRYDREFVHIKQRFDGVDKRLDAVDARLDTFETSVEERLDALEAAVEFIKETAITREELDASTRNIMTHIDRSVHASLRHDTEITALNSRCERNEGHIQHVAQHVGIQLA